jgi:ATP-dependent protease ClpP protease subunit
MARDNPPPDLSAVLAEPQISLMGEVDKFMARELRDGLRAEKRDGDGPVVVEITTAGGDAELVRRMVTDVDEARARLAPRRLVFSGKTMVYSAGTTLMSAFPVEDRYLSKDAMVMIHCRQLSKTVEIDGPIRGSLPRVTALLHQLETGVELEKQHFERLIAGSRVPMDELFEKALYNWYLTAAEALELRLVAGLI